MKGGSPSSFVLFFWGGGFTAVASVSCGCVCGQLPWVSRCNGGFVCTRLIGLLFSFGLVG